MQEPVHRSAEAMNAIFAKAGIRFLKAVPTKYGADDALRIIYAGSCLADPRADLKGEDRRPLASAFIKAGLPAGEYLKLLEGKNEPALYMEVYTPPVDMLWTVTRGHIHPWTMYVLCPDADYFETRAEALARELALRFKTDALVHS
ncbi:MAG: hypothetical protein EBQ96_04305 [Proteobacteria bacterium]|nr:hypothetical protein [Pseudomonadota bacterium]